MRRADIEVPNLAVDVNSWARSACYPRGSFYPLSHTPSTRKCGITKPDFRPCSARRPRSQAPLCLCTLGGWYPFTLREPLGASVTLWEATAPVKLPAWPCLPSGLRMGMSDNIMQEWYFSAASPSPSVAPHRRKLLGHPFFRRYGVNLPSSLTEVGSSTWGGFSLPTGVGVRYGQNAVWLAAFLGGLGSHDFRPLARTRRTRHA